MAAGPAVAARIEERSARGIAAAISRMITDGSLAPGFRLPTVRDLAAELGVSPTTVGEAWQRLAAVGAVAPRGRLGTFVVGPPTVPAPRRYSQMPQSQASFRLDLSTGTPDPDLLPDLGSALASVARRNLTTTYLDDPVLDSLGTALRELWPFRPEALTVVDGAMDALDRVLCATVRLGDRVLVEEATFPPLLDLLEQLGAEVIGLPIDESGIVPAGLEAALASGPSVLCIQPRAHNPTGVSMTSARARALAGLLGDREVLVVEDDHAGDIASARAVSLGRWLPERTVHIRSFSKSHGPDLRLAAVGGAEAVVSRVVARRLLGPGWSSRLLQQVLVELLRDPAAIASVAAARAEYAARRAAFCAGLTERGVGFTGTDGINLWIEVADEQAALVSLAAQGIGVAPGRPFVVEPTGEFIRLTVGRVSHVTDDLLDAVARAALGAERTGFRPLSR